MKRVEINVDRRIRFTLGPITHSLCPSLSASELVADVNLLISGLCVHLTLSVLFRLSVRCCMCASVRVGGYGVCGSACLIITRLNAKMKLAE